MLVEENNSYLDHLSIINGYGGFIAEPPKQLKLEQFLQQLSKITISNQQKPNLNPINVQSEYPFNYCPSMCLLAQNNYIQIKHGSDLLNSIKMPNNYVTNNHIKELDSTHCPDVNLVKIAENVGDKMIDNLENSSLSIYKYLNQSEQQKKTVQVEEKNEKHLQKEPREQQEQRLEQKLKRNTTSTTTSGHGTISEGECSSIAKKTSSISTQSYASNTASIMVVQRQPASSGYESTIQDDEDANENGLVEENKNYRISEHIRNNDGLVKKKLVMVGMVMDQKFKMKGRKRKNKNCLNRIRLWNNKSAHADATVSCRIAEKSSVSRFNENESVQTTIIGTGKLNIDHHLLMLDKSAIPLDDINLNPDRNNVNNRPNNFCSFLCCGI